MSTNNCKMELYSLLSTNLLHFQSDPKYLRLLFLATILNLATFSEKELATTNFSDFKDFCWTFVRWNYIFMKTTDFSEYLILAIFSKSLKLLTLVAAIFELNYFWYENVS